MTDEEALAAAVRVLEFVPCLDDEPALRILGLIATPLRDELRSAEYAPPRARRGAVAIARALLTMPPPDPDDPDPEESPR